MDEKQTDMQTETAIDTQTETATDTQAETVTGTQAETEKDTQAETEKDTQTETATDMQADTQADTQTDTQAKTGKVGSEIKNIKGKISDKRADLKGRTKIPRFMKFLMVIFTLNFVLTAICLIITSRDLIDYNNTTLFDFANIVFEMVLLWMLWCRFKCARTWALIFTAGNIIVGWSLNFFVFNNFNLVTELASSSFDIVMFLYFLTSKKARAALNQPFGIDKQSAAPVSKELVINRRSWPFWRNLGIYFCVFSLVGHWMEAGLSQLMALGIIQGEVDYTNTMLWRDWFYPFPMEGAAVVFIALFLYPLWRWLMGKFKVPGFAYLLSFIANMLLCVCIEFGMGMFVNADLQLWDYTDMPFNFMGQVCAQNAFGFGLVASIITWIVYPALERLFAKIPLNVMNLVFVVVCAAYMIPQTLYLIDPPLTTEEQIEFALESGTLDEQTAEEYQNILDEMHQRQAAQAAKRNQ